MNKSNHKNRDFTLSRLNRPAFTLSKYQEDKYAILVFYRGYWCQFCRKQLADINDHLHDFESRSAVIAAISRGKELQGSILQNIIQAKFPILSDPAGQVFSNFGLPTEELENAPPAIIILDPEQRVVYQYIGRDYKDRLYSKNIISQLVKLQNYAKGDRR